MKLNYKSFGQGFPIIILHGLFGMLDNWQTIAKKLAANFSVYIVDQRNHGRSPHAAEMNYAAMADDLQAFMEANWIYEAHIIGHSMGGKTAMQFALSYPDLVEKLVVVDIAPKAYPIHHQSIFDTLLALDLTQITSRKEAATRIQIKIRDSGTQQFLLKNLQRTKEGAFKWKMNLPVLYQQYDRIREQVIMEEEAFDHPTLFIKGGQSRYIQAEDTALIKTYFSEATIATIPDAGHWVHATAPDRMLALLLDFLETS